MNGGLGCRTEVIPERWRAHRGSRHKDMAAVKESYTGRYLKEMIGRRAAHAGVAKKKAAE